jgi:hypothetical protein
MKAGVAVWRALRSFGDAHPAWDHLEGRPQAESDLPRPITVAYKSVYDKGAAEEARAALEGRAAGGAGVEAPRNEGGGGADGGGGGGERGRVSFDAATEPRTLDVRSWDTIGRYDLKEWYMAPPGQPLASEAAMGVGNDIARATSSGDGMAAPGAAGGLAAGPAVKPQGAGAVVRVDALAVAE